MRRIARALRTLLPGERTPQGSQALYRQYTNARDAGAGIDARIERLGRLQLPEEPERNGLKWQPVRGAVQLARHRLTIANTWLRDGHFDQKIRDQVSRRMWAADRLIAAYGVRET